MKKYMPLLFCLAFVSKVQAQIPTIEDLSFIAGNWLTTTDWGEMQEQWTPPMGNTMMGSFRCINEGQPLFYEFMTIEQADEATVPTLYLRHFSAGSIAWESKEEPNVYPLFEIGENRAVFCSLDGQTKLLFERKSKKNLIIILLELEKEAWKETIFSYRRKR